MNAPENIGYQSLVELWSEERRKSRSSSQALKIVLGCGLLVFQISFAVTAWSAFHSRDYITLCLVLFISAPVIWATAAFWKKWKRARGGNIFLGGVTPAPSTLHDRIWEILSAEAMSIGISQSKLRVFVKTDRLDVNLGVFESDEAVFVFISLGFTKLLYSDAVCAKAMLLHELAHVINADSKLWTIVNIFYSVHLRILLPTMMVLTLTTILISSMGLYRIGVARETLKQERAKIDAQLDAVINRPQPYTVVSNAYFTEVSNAYLMKIDLFLKYSKQDVELINLKEEFLFSLCQLLLSSFGVGFLYLTIKSARRQSERLADVAVSLFQAGSALRGAIEKYGVEVWKSNLMDCLIKFHPSQVQRLKELERDAEILSAMSIDSPPIRSLQIRRKRGQLYCRLKFSAVVGGVLAAGPTFWIMTEERGENGELLERIGMCLCIFLGLVLISLITYSVAGGIAVLASRKKTIDSFPFLQSRSGA